MLQVSGTRHLQIKYQHRSNGQYLSIPDYDRAAEVVLNATDHCNRHLCLSKRQAAQRLSKPLHMQIMSKPERIPNQRMMSQHQRRHLVNADELLRVGLDSISV
jgi:hypothetical protein